MKKIFFPLLLMPFIGFSQVDSIPIIDGNYGYNEVVSLDTAYKKNDLYNNGKIYFANEYKSAKDVIQYDSKEDNKIIGKGLFEVYSKVNALATMDCLIYFTTEITCKDGKYRYRIYDIHIKQIGEVDFHPTTIDNVLQKANKGMAKKIFSRLYDKITDEFKSTIKSLKLQMAKRPVKDDF